MVIQIIAGAAWLLWLISGTAGLENGLTVGALLIVGFGLKNLLDTFWKHKQPEKEGCRSESEFKQPSRFLPKNKVNLPSPNWTLAVAENTGSSSILRRLERR